jgi:photosystem II stability/assembly factor-like uncharacterized protein
MRGDYSRLTFRPENHYSGVRLQQGRVQLDADFNEQVDIEAHRDQMTALDTIGRHGVPLDGGGFAVSVATNLLGVAFASANNVWAVGEDGAVLRASDGGQNWTLQPPPPGPTARLEAIAFRDATDAHAVGSRGTILALSGTTWTSQGNPALTRSDLHAVTFPDATHGWAVGNGGTILFWNGTTWARQQAQDVTGPLRGVHFVSATRGWVVGDNGLILTTSNGGTTWTAQTSGIGTSLRGVHFQSATVGYAVGSSATILVTTDGGTTWTKKAAPQGVTANLAAVRSTSATDVVAVGNGGTVLTSSDAGQTWALKQPAASSANLRGLAASGASLVAVGDGAVVRGTVPGAWSAATLPASGRTLSFSPGDLYVEGLRVANERRTTFTSQPNFPFDVDQLPASEQFPPADGTWGLYLRAREMHVTALERDELREKALGGPDTASRTQTVWQLRMKRITAANPTCADFDLSAPPEPASSGTLRARSQPGQAATNECMVPAGGGYRRLENQLYRVEIHDTAANPANRAVKWSRDNGSLAARMEAVTTASTGLTGSATVSTVGRDDVLGFAPKQILELTDEGRVLRGQPGVLVEITGVRGKIIDFKLDVAQQLTLANFPHAPTVRRWDGTMELAAGGGWKPLEQGVEIQFGAGPFRNGDWWTIPARTLTASVEWPRNGSGPEFRPPEGVVSYFAPLAIADVAGGTWTNVRDCRHLFPPLTGLRRLSYVGGSGQEKMPKPGGSGTVALDRPLQVAVDNGSFPVEGARVRFTRQSGNGTLSGGTGPGPHERVIPTGPDGVASCSWAIDSGTQLQDVLAELLDDQDGRVDVPARFLANLSRASEVRYEPGNCPSLAGDDTVQQALDKLSHLTTLEKLAGDAQLIGPGESPQELQVRAVNHCGAAIETGEVRFQVVIGGGQFPNGQDNIDMPLTNGTCTVGWQLGDSAETQWVTATLKKAVSGGVALPLREPPPEVWFSGTLSRASHVSYDPSNCAALAEVDNVQDAIDALCRRPTGGCAVVVRPDTQLLRVLRELLDQGERDICICLTAGDHELADDVVLDGENKGISLKLSGCGPGTRVTVSKGIDLGRLAAVVVRDMELVLAGEGGFSVIESPEVALERLHVRREAGGGFACLIGGAQRIRVENSVIDVHLGMGERHPPIDPIVRVLRVVDRRVAVRRAESLAQRLAGDPAARRDLLAEIRAAAVDIRRLPDAEEETYLSLTSTLELDQPERSELLARILGIYDAVAHSTADPALVLMDAEAHTEITGNQLVGSLSLYGKPDEERQLTVDQLTAIRGAFAETLSLGSSSGTLRLHDNLMSRLTLGEDALRQLEEVAAEPGLERRISGVYRSSLVVGNVFHRHEQQMLAEHLTLTADDFASHRTGHGFVVAPTVIVTSSRTRQRATLLCAVPVVVNQANVVLQVVVL